MPGFTGHDFKSNVSEYGADPVVGNDTGETYSRCLIRHPALERVMAGPVAEVITRREVAAGAALRTPIRGFADFLVCFALALTIDYQSMC